MQSETQDRNQGGAVMIQGGIQCPVCKTWAIPHLTVCSTCGFEWKKSMAGPLVFSDEDIDTGATGLLNSGKKLSKKHQMGVKMGVKNISREESRLA